MWYGASPRSKHVLFPGTLSNTDVVMARKLGEVSGKDSRTI